MLPPMLNAPSHDSRSIACIVRGGYMASVRYGAQGMDVQAHGLAIVAERNDVVG